MQPDVQKSFKIGLAV